VVTLEKIIHQVPYEMQQYVIKMVQNSEFKRKQAPEVIYVQGRPFGLGRRIAVTSKNINI